MKKKPHHILQRFPERADDLLMLLANNPDFQDLCDDYDVCVQAKQYWGRSTEPEAGERVAEYHTIALELEEEIVQKLKLQTSPEQPGSKSKYEKEPA